MNKKKYHCTIPLPLYRPTVLYVKPMEAKMSQNSQLFRKAICSCGVNTTDYATTCRFKDNIK